MLELGPIEHAILGLMFLVTLVVGAVLGAVLLAINKRLKEDCNARTSKD